MANIVITTVDANHIKIEFNDYFTDGEVDTKIAWVNRTDIEEVLELDCCIDVHLVAETEDWHFSDAEDLSNNILQIDNIDGTTTWASLTVLGTQLAALMVA